MTRGSITLDDARLVQEFALHVQPILRHADSLKLVEQAKTVGRIAYCAIADARYQARAERARQACFMIPPPGFIQD